MYKRTPSLEKQVQTSVVQKGMTGLYHRHNKMNAHCITLMLNISHATNH